MSELILHRQVVQYIKTQYPTVLFRTDYSAGQYKASMYHRRIHKELQAGRAWPDLFIAEPRGKFAGLFLELKRDGTRVFRQDGKLVANKHFREQDEMLQKLHEKGYKAHFAIGLDRAKAIIDWYLTSS